MGRYSLHVADTSPHHWREAVLWTKIITVLEERYQSFLKSLYNKYAGSIVLHAGEKGLHLAEFKTLFMQAKLASKSDAPLLKALERAFMHSKMLEVQDGIVKLPRLTYVEFFEALCRAAEVLSPVYRKSVL
jgi:hypothetical protein